MRSPRLRANLPGVRLQLTRENPQQAGFATAVAAHEPDFFPGRNRESYRFQQTLISISQCQVIGGEQRWAGNIHGALHWRQTRPTCLDGSFANPNGTEITQRRVGPLTHWTGMTC